MLNIDEDKLKLLLKDQKNKIERPKYNGLSDILSGFSIILTLCFADFSQVTIINPLYFQIGAWILAICILLFGICSFIGSIRNFYSVDSLYSEIADLDPNTEHPFNIVLIKSSPESGKYLLFKSTRWSCWLFPNYHCLASAFDIEAEKAHINKCLKRDLNASNNITITYLGNIISNKYSVGDKINKKYNFHFFEISTIEIQSAKKYSFRSNGKKYCWKTLDQMYSSKNIVKKNSDVLDYVRKNCDVN